MKFKLSVSEHLYRTNRPAKEEERQRLTKLGFRFSHRQSEGYWLLEDGDEAVPPTIEIENLEDLMAFVKEHGTIVMYDGTIEIYNGYRE